MPRTTTSAFAVPTDYLAACADLNVHHLGPDAAIVEVRVFASHAEAAAEVWEAELVDERLRFAGTGWRAYDLRGGGARAVAGRLVVTAVFGTEDRRDHESCRRLTAVLFDAIVAEHGACG